MRQRTRAWSRASDPAYRAAVTGDHEPVVPTTTGLVPSVDGVPISFETTASRDRALVFVHGWSCDRTYWRHQVAVFAAEYEVVTIDLAGHGASGAGRTSWTMQAFGEDVIAVVDALQLRDAVLVGHSMGGDVIVEAALGLGDRVAGIVWVDTYRQLTGPRTPEQLDALLEPFRADFAATTRQFVRMLFPAATTSTLVAEIAADMTSAPPAVAVNALRHSWEHEGAVMAGLPRLNVPVVAINPDFQPTDAVSLGAFGIETVIASGVGHFLMLEDADQFNRLLADVLAGIPHDRP
jgi:pimeloyl-ACP methyl ester carboxylesterase